MERAQNLRQVTRTELTGSTGAGSQRSQSYFFARHLDPFVWIALIIAVSLKKWPDQRFRYHHQQSILLIRLPL
jgi:hypothetical protein